MTEMSDDATHSVKKSRATAKQPQSAYSYGCAFRVHTFLESLSVMQHPKPPFFPTTQSAAFWWRHLNQPAVMLFSSWLGGDFNFAALLQQVEPQRFINAVVAVRVRTLGLSLSSASVDERSRLWQQLGEALAYGHTQQEQATRVQSRQGVLQLIEQITMSPGQRKRLEHQIETLHRLGYRFDITAGLQPPTLTGKTLHIGEHSKLSADLLIFYFSQVVIDQNTSYDDVKGSRRSSSLDMQQLLTLRAEMTVTTTSHNKKSHVKALQKRLQKAIDALVAHHWFFVGVTSNTYALSIDHDGREIFFDFKSTMALRELVAHLETLANAAHLPGHKEFLISRYGRAVNWEALSHDDAQWLKTWAGDAKRYGKNSMDFKTNIYPKLGLASAFKPTVHGVQLPDSDLQVWENLAQFFGVSNGVAAREKLEQLEQAFHQKTETVRAVDPQAPDLSSSMKALNQLQPAFDWRPIASSGNPLMAQAVMTLLNPENKMPLKEKLRQPHLVNAAKVMGYSAVSTFEGDLMVTSQREQHRWAELGIYNPTFRSFIAGWPQEHQDVLATFLKALQNHPQPPVTLQALALVFRQLRPHGPLQVWMRSLAQVIAPSNQGYPKFDLNLQQLSNDERAIAEVLVRIKPHLQQHLDLLIDRLLSRKQI
jgi:hypothetical protein